MSLPWLVLAALAAAAPLQATTIERSADGRLLYAGGHASPSLDATPASSARAFVTAHAAELGLLGRHGFAAEPAPEGAGAVRFRHLVDGLPVFNGAIQVAVDGAGAVHSVRASDVPPVISGRFALDDEGAARAALAAVGRAARWAGLPNVRRGWYALTTRTRAAFEVEQSTANPPGAWLVTVDAETGEVLFRHSRRMHETLGQVYELSPVELPAGALCPMSAGDYALCAKACPQPLPNLSGATLAGSQAGPVYNCRGGDYPEAPGATGSCTEIAEVNGGYDFAPDETQASETDAFAGVMAYYQLDRHASFLKRLDPSCAEKLAPLPAFVNAYEAGQPYANAHFDAVLGGIVFGQGAKADLAYDASVIFHERSHAAFEQVQKNAFSGRYDGMGALLDPLALNEGSADTLAAAHTGKSEIGFYSGNRLADLPYLRDLDKVKTCKGTGTRVVQAGLTVVDGLDGEEHDDGEIWSGFSWELTKALQGATACSDDAPCPAAAAIQFKAAQLGAGGYRTFQTYAQDLATAAGLVLAGQPGLLSQAQSAIQAAVASHDLQGCDRTFPLYAGEQKLQYVGYRYGSFQFVFQTTGVAALTICSASGSAAHAWIRKDQPVTLVDGKATGGTSAPGSKAVVLTKACGGLAGNGQVTLIEAGTWYLLLEVDPASATEPSPADAFLVRAGTSGVKQRDGSATSGSTGATGELTASKGGGGCSSGGGLSLLALAPLLPFLGGRRRAWRQAPHSR